MQCNYLLALELKKNEQLAKGVYIFVFFLRLLNDFSTFTIKKKKKSKESRGDFVFSCGFFG
jgi:hypothetical protein